MSFSIWTERFNKQNYRLYLPMIEELVSNHGDEICWMYGSTGFLVFECGTDELLAGVCYDVGKLSYPFENPPDAIIISSIFVHDEYRKKGIARHLVHLCEKEAEILGLNYVSLEPARSNGVRDFWKKIGYKSCSPKFETYKLQKKLDQNK
jgi:GNAT superfamily N-acetyltransferase